MLFAAIGDEDYDDETDSAKDGVPCCAEDCDCPDCEGHDYKDETDAGPNGFFIMHSDYCFKN